MDFSLKMVLEHYSGAKEWKEALFASDWLRELLVDNAIEYQKRDKVCKEINVFWTDNFIKYNLFDQYYNDDLVKKTFSFITTKIDEIRLPQHIKPKFVQWLG
jgi:hypothetical protein